MKTTTNIYLTSRSASADWQENNAVQIINSDIHIYLKTGNADHAMQVQKAARVIENLGVSSAKLMGEKWCSITQWAFALGFSSVKKPSNVEFTGDDATINLLNSKLAVYAWCRDVTNQTPAQLYPLKLAELARDYLSAQAPAYISSTIVEGEQLAEQGWLGIYNVGKGSVNAPCLIEIDYNPSLDKNAPVSACLVGKGITFDSGGYSLKSNVGMFDMKCDMGGAAVVTAALALAIRQGLDKRVKLYLCCAENMVSSGAYKLGDIIQYKNGVTMEVANTDAEGRIVLADGLLAASENNAPLIIDAATLTGAAVMATGGDYTALFALNDNAATNAMHKAKAVNEPMWQLPLAPWHQDKCPSAFADTANSRTQKGGGAGGASNAAGFLSRFVDHEQSAWLHFDLAGAYNGSANSMWSTGATGLGIATISEILING